jgi:hypothetical protein
LLFCQSDIYEFKKERKNEKERKRKKTKMFYSHLAVGQGDIYIIILLFLLMIEEYYIIPS